jgi:chromosome segregation ATPase
LLDISLYVFPNSLGKKTKKLEEDLNDTKNELEKLRLQSTQLSVRAHDLESSLSAKDSLCLSLEEELVQLTAKLGGYEGRGRAMREASTDLDEDELEPIEDRVVLSAEEYRSHFEELAHSKLQVTQLEEDKYVFMFLIVFFFLSHTLSLSLSLSLSL